MARDTFSTAQVARAAGLHPNTIRLYEQWGYIAPVPRAANGYRQFNQVHVRQVRLIKQAHHCTWLSGEVRKTGLALIERAAAQDWDAARRVACQLYDAVRSERRQAEAAAEYLEQWAKGILPSPQGRPLRIGETARLLDTTIDSLRNWERNGLIAIPRDPKNGYRLYGPLQIGRLRIIRALIRSRYSIMAILRMLTRLDEGKVEQLRDALDTPRPDEDVFYFTDRLLTTLAQMETHAQEAIALLAEPINSGRISHS